MLLNNQMHSGDVSFVSLMRYGTLTREYVNKNICTTHEYFNLCALWL